MTDARPIFPVVFLGRSSGDSTLRSQPKLGDPADEPLTRAVDGSNVRDFRPIVRPATGDEEAPKASSAQSSAKPLPVVDSTLSLDGTDNPATVEKENPPASGSDGEQQPKPQSQTIGSSSPLVLGLAPVDGETRTSSSPEQ